MLTLCLVCEPCLMLTLCLVCEPCLMLTLCLAPGIRGVKPGVFAAVSFIW